MRDLVDLYESSHADESAAALRWYRGLKRAILTLESHPARCARRTDIGGLRQLLYGRKPHAYRVIFHIHELRKLGDVLHIRHGARKAPQRKELI